MPSSWTRRRAARRWAALAAAAITLGVSACGSEELPARPTVSAPSQPRIADVADGAGVRFSAEGPDGARVGLSLRVGAPRPVQDVTDEGVEACRFLLRSNDDEDDAVAVPVTLTAKIPSGAPATAVTVDLGAIYLVDDDEIAQSYRDYAVWAVQYASTAPQCKHGRNAPTVRWGSLEPGAERTWSTWMVLFDETAYTPGAVLLRPAPRVGGVLGSRPEYLTPSGDHHVRCRTNPDADERSDFIAVGPDEALESGCVTETNAERSPITDRICQARYPGGGTTPSTNGATTYDRIGSLFQMCHDFGKPEKLRITPGMRCALLEAAATVGTPPTMARDISGLCDTQSIIEAYNDGSWIKAAGSEGCAYVAEGLGAATGILVAGTSGPVGPVLGVGAYKALSATLKIVCGGIFEDGAQDFGEHLQGKHEARVRRDILERGKCLQIKRNSQPAAVNC